MTEDDKYEITVLASDLAEKRVFYEQRAMMNAPTDPAEQQKAQIAFSLAQTEYLEAHAALARAQFRMMRQGVLIRKWESKYWEDYNRQKPERDAEIIRRYKEGGITQRKLAEEYGISPERVFQIIRRRRS